MKSSFLGEKEKTLCCQTPKLGVLFNIFTCMLTTYKVGLIIFILSMREIRIKKVKCFDLSNS